MYRDKNKFILLKIQTKKTYRLVNLNQNSFLKELYRNHKKNYGVLGLAKIYKLIQIKYLAREIGTILMRCPSKQMLYVWHTLILMDEFQMQKIVVTVLRVRSSL